MSPAAHAYHASATGDVLAILGSSPDGLASVEAARRLKIHGPNELPAPRTEPIWLLVVRQFRSAIALLLVAGIVLSMLAGDRLDALAIGVALLLNVPGDIVLLEEGVLVPADVRLLEATELRMNESLLTGESAVVEKDANAALDPRTLLAERRTMAYQGSAVAAGRGRAIVVATGAATELGRIGALVERVRPGRTSLERKLDALGRQLAVAALALALAVIFAGLARGMEAGALIQLGIALAVAAVPGGLPAVATIALAVGLRRMARQRALVRQLPVVESLGSVTVVCADKTGTLTAGAMTATSIWCAGRSVAVTGSGYEPRGEFLRDGQRVEPGDALVMQRPPRRPEHGLLTRSLLGSAVGHALLIAAATLITFALTMTAANAGTVAFLTLAVAQVLHLGNARSTMPTVHPKQLLANKIVLAGAAVSLALVAATNYVPALADVLSLQSIDRSQWAVVLSLGAAPAIAGQIWRWFRAGDRTMPA